MIEENKDGEVKGVKSNQSELCERERIKSASC